MHRHQIVFGSLLGFLGGVAAASFFHWAPDPGLGLLMLAVLAAGFLLFWPSRGGPILLVFLVFLTGVLWTARSLQSFEGLEASEVRGVGRIILDPERRDFYRETILRVEACESAACPEKLVLWRAPLDSDYPAGTRLSFECRLEIPENFDPDFDYRMYLAKDGIGYLCRDLALATVLPGDFLGRLFRGLYAPKHYFEQALIRALPQPEAGLAQGLLLGGDNYLSENFQEAFRRIGLSHVVAISGYNITLIIECFLLFGLALGLWRRQALYTALIGIVLFILMIGLPPSAVRAGVMAGVVFLAWQFGRLARPYTVLLAAAAVLLVLNPLLLRYDIGFQLSFLATLALATARPFEARIFSKEFFGVGFFKIVWYTFIVNLFVLPIILYQFHFFSPLTLVSNLLTVFVPWAMLFSFFLALLLLVLPAGSFLLALPAFLPLSAMTYAVEYLNRLPGASVAVENFTLWHLATWYGLLLAVIVFLEKKRKRLAHVYPI